MAPSAPGGTVERRLRWLCGLSRQPVVFVRNASPSRPSFSLSPALRALVTTLQERRARTLADRELARRVRDAVERSTGGSGLSFYVHEGTVTVYGPALDRAARENVLRQAAAQPGARRIIDHTSDDARPPAR
jgi:hypothetical protein